MSTKTSKSGSFEEWLRSEEKSATTIEKYSSEIERFRIWLRENDWDIASADALDIKNAVVQ